MLQQQLQKYFGLQLIYEFNGEPTELLDLLNNDYSINYITADYKTYFISDKIPPTNSRITLFLDNTQGAI